MLWVQGVSQQEQYLHCVVDINSYLYSTGLGQILSFQHFTFNPHILKMLPNMTEVNV